MNNTSYWLLIVVLFAVSLYINKLRGGGKVGMEITIVFFIVAIVLNFVFTSQRTLPIVF